MSSSGNNVTFNQDMTRMSVGTDSGFQIFDLPPATNYRRIRSEQSLGGVSQVAMLEKTPLIAVVGGTTNNSSKRFLQLYDLQHDKVLAELHYRTPILNVRMNRKRLSVILERHIHIYDLQTLQSLPSLTTINPPNRLGLGALSCVMGNGACFFAFPQSSNPNVDQGDLFLIDVMDSHMQQIGMIPAHNTVIAALEFCGSGTRIATCSVKGTVIRVYSNPSPTLLYTFRRGQQEAIIYSLAFNYAGDLLAVASNSGTVHVFQCEGEQNQLGGNRSSIKVSVAADTETIVGLDRDGKLLSVVQGSEEHCMLTQYELPPRAVLTSPTSPSGQVKLAGEYTLW